MREAANTEAEGGSHLVIVRLPAVTSASDFSALEKRSEMDVFCGWSWQTVKEGVGKQELQDGTCFGNDLTAIC